VHLGLRTQPVQSVDDLDDDFGLSYSQVFTVESFRDRPALMPVPISQQGVIDLMKTIDVIFESLNEGGVTEDNYVCYRNLRQSLIVLLISDSVYISDKITVIEDAAGEDSNAVDADDEAWVDTELFIVILYVMLELCGPGIYAVNCRQHLPYVCANRLVSGRILDKPIMEFGTVELLDAFHLVAYNFHRLRYNEELNQYLDYLLCRLASMFFIPQETKYSGGRKDHEEEVDDEGRFTLRYKIVRNIGWAVKNMWKKLKIHEWVARKQCPAEDMPHFSEHDRKRLLDCCLFTDSGDDLQRPFLNFCLNTLLMPGEVEHFRAERPNKDPRVDRVLKLRPAYGPILRRQSDLLSGPVANLVTDTSEFGECIGDLALTFIVSLYMSNAMGLQFTEAFVIFYDWLDKHSQQLQRQLSTRNYPIILQSFNWIGLYYNEVFYEHASVLNAVLHWMQIISGPPFNYIVNGASILSLELHEYDFYRLLVQEKQLRL